MQSLIFRSIFLSYLQPCSYFCLWKRDTKYIKLIIVILASLSDYYCILNFKFVYSAVSRELLAWVIQCYLFIFSLKHAMEEKRWREKWCCKFALMTAKTASFFCIVPERGTRETKLSHAISRKTKTEFHYENSWSRESEASNESRVFVLFVVFFILFRFQCRWFNRKFCTHSSGDGWCRTMWIIRPGGYNGLCSVNAIELSFGYVLAFRAVLRCCDRKRWKTKFFFCI